MHPTSTSSKHEMLLFAKSPFAGAADHFCDEKYPEALKFETISLGSLVDDAMAL